MTIDRATEFVIRPANEGDCHAIAVLIRELAAYKRLEDQAKSTVNDLARNRAKTELRGRL
jgi:N-acetylglutamate synthase-like GNAT family acetyltransferase